MILRKLLLATTILALPLAAQAQTQPVTGIYVGAIGGFNIKTSPNVNNIQSNIPGSAALSTPNVNLSTGIGGAGVGAIGYGLGNGLRLEVEGDYRGNSFSTTSGQNVIGAGVSTGASGNERLYGPMVNAVYDFHNLVPFVVPYVGVGVGYQWAQLHNFSTTGLGAAGAATTITSNDRRGSFAAQGIVGAGYQIPSVPGLELTAEYRILALTGTRTYNAGFTTTTPGAAPVTRFGKFELGHDLNNTFLFGIRYAFNAAPPPPPPAPIVAPAPAPSRSYLVFFDWDKATLTDRARQIIKDAADNSTRVQYTRIEVNGYTDTSGTPAYNQKLSVRRAQAVAAELTRNGVPASAITIQGFGDTRLLVATGPNVREPQNRRVEIIVR
jgi:outer membrane protein OmpA-like peptidoglycan-associated protein